MVGKLERCIFVKNKTSSDSDWETPFLGKNYVAQLKNWVQNPNLYRSFFYLSFDLSFESVPLLTNCELKEKKIPPISTTATSADDIQPRYLYGVFTAVRTLELILSLSLTFLLAKFLLAKSKISQNYRYFFQKRAL